MVSQTGCVYLEATTTATPTPNPVPQRRVLDPFDLNNSTNPPASASDKDASAEKLDKSLYDAINQLVEHSNFIEAEFRRVTQQPVDMDPGSSFQKWFQHSVMAIRELSRNYREGTLFGQPIRSKSNQDLLLQNQYIAEDMMTLMSTAPADYQKDDKDLRGLSKVYGVPFPDTGVDKAGIVKAMFVQMNANFTTLQRQITVR
jgi:hypothetical protein